MGNIIGKRFCPYLQGSQAWAALAVHQCLLRQAPAQGCDPEGAGVEPMFYSEGYLQPFALWQSHRFGVKLYLLPQNGGVPLVSLQSHPVSVAYGPINWNCVAGGLETEFSHDHTRF